MFLRVLVVLAASTVGLGAGSLIYYALLEDGMIYRGSSRAGTVGNLYLMISVGCFLLTVYMLYLNQASPLLISSLGMLLTKFSWNCADGYRYAGKIHRTLSNINEEPNQVREFLKRADSYRQIQDLRSVARTMYAPDSRQLELLEHLTEQENSND